MRDLIKKIAEEGAQNFPEKLLIPLLASASFGYQAAVSVREKAFDAGWIHKKKLPVPVVSVGNITWGGTGKTPFVKFLAQKLELMGKKVMILTRGYSHDEVRELELGCPKAVLGVGKNRYEAAFQKLSRELPDIILLDDGFQHRQLFRDLDIVLVNAARPFGNGHLIPWGSLREPFASLGRAHLIVLTHADKIDDRRKSEIQNMLRIYAPNAKILEASHLAGKLFRARDQQELSEDFLNARELISVSGIGFPESFNWLIRSQGGIIKKSYEFSDHYFFNFKDLEEIRGLKEKGVAADIVITEKDYLRSPELLTEMLDPLVLRVQIKIDSGEPILDDRLHRLLAG